MENESQKISEENISLQEQLNIQQEALAKIYKSVESTRKMIFWTGVANLALFIIPMIAVAILLPKIIGTFTASLDSFSGASSSLVEISAEPSLRESLENLQGFGF